jgi:hypothetical protein
MTPKRKTTRLQTTEFEPVDPVSMPAVSIMVGTMIGTPENNTRILIGTEYLKLPRTAPPPRVNYNQLKWKYGLDREGFLRFWETQRGLCAICWRPLKRPCVDHCHATGLVRGLLCHGCNTALGKLQDSVVVLQRAISYLSR